VAVAVLVAGWLFGDEAAHLLGPYLVILAGAVVGAFVNAARRPARSFRADASVFVALVLAVVLTAVTVSEVLVSYAGVPDGLARSGIGLIALAIGAIGEDWLRIGHWGIGLARGVLEGLRRHPRDPGGPQ